jgi:hypothetical protein
MFSKYVCAIITIVHIMLDIGCCEYFLVYLYLICLFGEGFSILNNCLIIVIIKWINYFITMEN